MGHTFRECTFSNVQLENATVQDSKLNKVTIGKNSKLVSSTCEGCSIHKSKICEGSLIKDSTIAFSSIHACQIDESMLYYTDIQDSHLLRSNIYRGSCRKCQLEHDKIVDHIGYKSYIFDSELAENSLCKSCCVYNSHIHSVILKDSVYFAVHGGENLTQFKNSHYSGLAMVCPNFSQFEKELAGNVSESHEHEVKFKVGQEGAEQEEYGAV